MKTYNNLHDAYLGTLADVYDNPEYICAPRGQKIREKLDYTFKVLNPTTDPIVTKDEDRNKVIVTYTDKEKELYDSCSNKVEDFEKASKFWRKLANPDNTVNSAYGHLIWGKQSVGNPELSTQLISDLYEKLGAIESGYNTRALEYVEYFTLRNQIKKEIDQLTNKMITPWEWAKRSLINDKDTRQAFLRFSLPEHQFFGNKDQVCTLHGNFLIRDNKLNLSIVMRSNDLTLGLVYDLPWFISLIDKMVEQLKPFYPELEKGTYTHTAHSMHLYDRDEDKILKMLGRI